MGIRFAAGLALLVGALALAGCGGTVPPGDGGNGAPPGDTGGGTIEDTWLALLADMGLEPDQYKVLIEGRREGGELVLALTVPQDAPGELTFGDGLFGATAWSYGDGGWSRIDTADIRTEIAPILQPGQSAEVRLPVRAFEGGLPRVLVPVGGFAAWADIT
jgi:hypothetical protein